MVLDILSGGGEGKLMVGVKLKEYKKNKGLSSAELAKELGISEAYLSQVLSGKRIGMRKVVEFAEKLGLSVEYLTGRQVFLPIEGVLKAGAVVEVQDPPEDKIEVTNLPELRSSKLKNLYAVRVGDYLLPFAKKGDTLIVKKEFDGISYGDRVISLEGEIRRLRYVQGLDQNHIVLACVLNIAPAKILERESANLSLHKIIYQIYA